ncbi:hypothetical protein ACFLYN_04975 [Chloroflexota bacterium]
MRSEGFTSLGEMGSALAFHAVSLFIGMLLIQLGQRAKKTA